MEDAFPFKKKNFVLGDMLIFPGVSPIGGGEARRPCLLDLKVSFDGLLCHSLDEAYVDMYLFFCTQMCVICKRRMLETKTVVSCSGLAD